MEILFSVITPTFKTPFHKIDRLYNSLLGQTYTNWEWIVFDDSPSDYKETYDYIKKLSKKDDRISLYTENRNIGIIGEVKKKAFSLAKGEILVELDHDDELVDTCLENLLTGYLYSTDIGFVYGNACEIYEDAKDGSDILDYGNHWCFNYGVYKKSLYKGIEYKVAVTGNINSKTIRHITGIPNHVRSWRRDVYNKIGGHNKNMQVADDYELFVRTFLNTKIAKINVFTYIQYFERSSTNTQFIKNKDIQDLVEKTSNFYNNKIHKRFEELGVDDFAYDNGFFDVNIQNPTIEPYTNIIIPSNLLKTNINGIEDVVDNNLETIKKIKDDKSVLYGFSRVYNIDYVKNYKQTEHYSNLIKWIVKLTNCQNYLELGLEYGTTIQEIKNYVNLCVGVDMSVKEIINGENIEFYQLSTDEFFKNNNRNFDIIFIDADHNFNQVKKDFENSLKILNKYGIIILHDTDPIVKELLLPYHCSNAYQIVDYISQKTDLNIITLPIQETGLTLVMRKNDRRVFDFL